MARESFSSFVFVPEGAFAADYPYTEAFLTVDGAAGEAWPDSAYQERVDAVAQRFDNLSPRLSASRVEQLRRDAQAELDDRREIRTQNDHHLAESVAVPTHLDASAAG